MSELTAWRKGDLIELLNGKQLRLTSDGYFSEKEGRTVCDTEDGYTISYLTLIEEAKLIETGSGRKNVVPEFIIPQKLPTYLVRLNDFAIYEIDKSNNCYRSFTTKLKYPDGTRAYAQDNFTFENLTRYYDFFPIKKKEIPFYKKKHDLYYKWMAWASRPDGHGGSKGGTFDEYIMRFGDK